MFSTTDTQCLLILQSAAQAPVGVVLRTNDPTKARQAMYKARKFFGDASMSDLTFRVSPDDPEHEVWILRKSLATSIGITLKPEPAEPAIPPEVKPADEPDLSLTVSASDLF